MNRLFKLYLNIFVIVFIDDIPIYFHKENEYGDKLRIVLWTLEDRNLYATFSKCKFFLKSVGFLGYNIFCGGVQVVSYKIKRVKK